MWNLYLFCNVSVTLYILYSRWWDAQCSTQVYNAWTASWRGEKTGLCFRPSAIWSPHRLRLSWLRESYFKKNKKNALTVYDQSMCCLTATQTWCRGFWMKRKKKVPEISNKSRQRHVWSECPPPPPPLSCAQQLSQSPSLLLFVCADSVDAAWADNLVEKWNETHGLSPPPPSPHRQAEQAHCKLHLVPKKSSLGFSPPPPRQSRKLGAAASKWAGSRC